MVRAGVVDHPSKSLHSGFTEIQSPRRKNVIIAYERLRQLAGFKDYESFAVTHQKWVQNALKEIDTKRESQWTQSIAVGSNQFVERSKNSIGAMAKGRSVRPTNGVFELRETRSAYTAIFAPENCGIAPE